MRSDNGLFTFCGALLPYRRSVLGHHLVYRTNSRASGIYIGTNFAILQSLAPVEMRAVMAAINLFILNIVGLGLGPVGVGFISDLATPAFGIESIRYGLLATFGGYGLGRFTSSKR